MNRRAVIISAVSICVVAAIAVYGTSMLKADTSQVYSFLTEEELMSATADMDKSTLENSGFVVNGTIYKYNSDNQEWENTGVPSGLPDIDGADGKDGQSSYQLLVSKGYTGSEEEFNSWLGQLSDNSSSVYEEFVAQGFRGTEEEFLSSLSVKGDAGANGIDGIDGKDGADGKDGKDGQDGKDGADGRDGADGKVGKDGSSITIGEDGFFYYDGIKTELCANQDILSGLNVSADGRTVWTKTGVVQEDIAVQYADGYLQIKYSEDGEWTNLIALSSLEGDYWLPVNIRNHPACDPSLSDSSTAILKSSYVNAYEQATTWAELQAIISAGALEITDPINYDFSTNTTDRTIKLTSTAGDTAIAPVLNTSSYIENDTLQTYSLADNTFLSSIALLGTDGADAYEVGTIADAPPGDYTDAGWVLLEESVYTINETHPICGEITEEKSYYWYSDSWSCSNCGSGNQTWRTSSDNGSVKAYRCDCGKNHRLSDGSPDDWSTTYTANVWVILDNGQKWDLGTMTYRRSSDSTGASLSSGPGLIGTDYQLIADINCLKVSVTAEQRTYLEGVGLNADNISTLENSGKYMYCGLPS